jgi:hypothetical protein
MVYRMIARDTIEETVVALARRKAALFSGVMDDGDLFRAVPPRRTSTDCSRWRPTPLTRPQVLISVGAAGRSLISIARAGVQRSGGQSPAKPHAMKSPMGDRWRRFRDLGFVVGPWYASGRGHAINGR